MRKFVVFYYVKDMSVALFANQGTESDIKEFYKIVTDKILELKTVKSNNSNSSSCSISCSDSFSESTIKQVTPEYKKFLSKILRCKIKTELVSNSDFIKLLDYLNKFYYVYED